MNVTLQTHTHTHTFITLHLHSLSLSLFLSPFLAQPLAEQGKRSFLVPRGFRDSTGRQLRRQGQTQVELGPNPTQDAAGEMEPMGRLAERGAWNQMFRQGTACLS